MSTSYILIGALRRVVELGNAEQAALILTSTRRLWCALAPRISAASPLDDRMLALVEPAPTAWCAADLETQHLGEAGLRRVPETFVQLRRLNSSGRTSGDALSAMLSGVCRVGSPIREIVLHWSLVATLSTLAAISPALPRLERLELHNCSELRDELPAQLRGMTRLRVLCLCHIEYLTDDQLVAMLAESPLLESLSLGSAWSVTASFLGSPLLDNCSRTLRTLRLEFCSAIDDAGMAFVSRYTGLETFHLTECPLLTTVPLQQLRSVRDIRLGHLRNVTAINLSQLGNVTVLGDGFMIRSIGLTTLDLSSLANVTTIGDMFLADSSNLTAIDLTSLVSVTAVGELFLSRATRLTSLDLSGIENVATVGSYFLGHCSGLTELDVAGLRNLESIGTGFLWHCRNIGSLDFSAMRRLTKVGSGFIEGCGSLTRLRLSDVLLQHDSVAAEYKHMHVATVQMNVAAQ